MSKKIVAALRSVGAVVTGYLVIALGTTLTLEAWLGGVSYRGSSTAVLALAALGGVVSGVCGGYAAAWLAGRRPLLHACGVLVPLALDTTWVVTSGVSSDPVWFDLTGGASLMLAAVVGGLVRSRTVGPRHRRQLAREPPRRSVAIDREQ